VDTITLKDVLDWIDTGSPCDLLVITCDAKQNKGGEELGLKKARKHNPVKAASQAAITAAQPKTSIRRNPNHFENSTRNMILPNGEIRKIHIRLIRQFNGKIVM
jgi:hypothetical protein